MTVMINKSGKKSNIDVMQQQQKDAGTKKPSLIPVTSVTIVNMR